MKNVDHLLARVDMVIGGSLLTVAFLSFFGVLGGSSRLVPEICAELIPILVAWWSVVYRRQLLRVCLGILLAHMALLLTHSFPSAQELSISLVIAFSEMSLIQLALFLAGQGERNNPHADATLDPLTGFSLPEVFEAELALVASISDRQGLPFSVLGCEINGFAEYANQFGSQLGDKLMQLVALSIGDCVRLSDTIGRWDNDRFLVILTGTRESQVGRVIEKMSHRVSMIEAFDSGPVSMRFVVAEHHKGNDPLAVIEAVEKQLDTPATA